MEEKLELPKFKRRKEKTENPVKGKQKKSDLSLFG
jgi:hypothetical protein